MSVVSVSASDFKAHCLEYMNTANEKNQTFVITKYREPVAQLGPCDKEETVELFGLMVGTGLICGDITEPLDEKWEAYGEK
jgi:antitoxin (DNA-binding transcriptional repressor) of toxin-antitoxin stability system